MSLRWGILGTGNIANTFAKAILVSKKNTLVAVGSRNKDSAVKFGSIYGVPSEQCYGDNDQVLQDANVDIVYISSPHPYHFDMAMKAAKAKKHILLEKPAAITEKQVTKIIQTCQEHQVFLMEAYMYRCHPQTHRLVELIRDEKTSKIGKVKLIRANFNFDGRPLGPDSRLWKYSDRGGALLDIGGYPLSLARLVAGAVQQKNFTDPIKLQGIAHIQEDTKVDEWVIGSLEFENGITAQLLAGVFADDDCSVEILGSKGKFRIPNLWRPDLSDLLGPVQIEFTSFDNSNEVQVKKEIISIPLEHNNLYTFEADAVADAIEKKQLQCEYMSWDDTLGQARAMDKWRYEVGLKFPEDDE
ncbi:unnamed protein product [Cunninghamella blakesleeana]